MTSLVVRPSVVVVPDRDGYLAYDPAFNRLYHLNPTAALVLELLRTPREVDDLRTAIEPVLGPEGWADCHAWLAKSLVDGLFANDVSVGDAESTASELVREAVKLRDQDRVLAAYVCQRRAAELAPDAADVWYELGELAHIVGRRDVARGAYTRYAEAHPDDAEVEHLLVSLTDQTPPPRVPDRAVHQLYARFSEFYDDSMEGDLGYRAPGLLAAAIARSVGARTGLRALDLGCGSGLGGQPLRPRASHLTGVDLSPEMIERARVRGVYDALHVAEITAFLAASPTQSYDLILSCDALIYFGDLSQVLVPAGRLLAAGGLVAFTVERSVEHPFRLTDSGRFAHHADHVAEVAASAGLFVDTLDEAILRWEYGEPVVGLVVVCHRLGPRHAARRAVGAMPSL